MKIYYLSFVVICLFTLVSCEDKELGVGVRDTAITDKLKGAWVPVSLAMKYQVGLTPRQKDTTVTLTPATAPLLVPGRANPIMPFTDTLYLGSQRATLDTFWIANRGIRQQGNFSVVSVQDMASKATLLRFGKPTYSKGKITRWNYDFVFHGTVSVNATGMPVYAVTTYANYSPSIQSVTDTELVLSFSSQGNVGNLPVQPVTTSNQLLNSVWGGRAVLFTATYRKR